MALPRDPWRLFLAPFRAANYRTLARSVRVFERPFAALYRYVSNRGSYPYEIALKTPTGRLAIDLPSFHDLRTVNEIFNRQDYGTRDDIDVVVDLGANIGISALYFLSRNRHCSVYCFEPSPVNLPRLERNLHPYADRVVIDPRAVSDVSGTFQFNAEPVGRYGGLLSGDYTAPVVNVIDVEVIDINSALESVLARESRIDVLKIDTEGTEIPIVKAIRPDLLSRIGEIVLEARVAEPLFPGQFAQTDHASGVCRLAALEPAPQQSAA